MRPYRTAPNSSILLEVMPIFNEKPETQALKLLRNKPVAPTNPGLPKEQPSVFNFIKGSSGLIHLIVLGIPILIVLAGQAK